MIVCCHVKDEEREREVSRLKALCADVLMGDGRYSRSESRGSEIPSVDLSVVQIPIGNVCEEHFLCA